MRQFLYLLSLLIFTPEILCAQFGLASEIKYSGFEETSNVDLHSPNSNTFYAIGPVYTFRLKRKRLEFFPSLMAGFGKLDFEKNDVRYSEWDFSFRMPIAVYPFDFDNDCNCPTFNKQGEAFRKGFYLVMTPGIHYQSKNIDNNALDAKLNSISYAASIGIGFDFALSRSSTLSPNIQVFRTFGDRYYHDVLLGEISTLKASRTGLALNIRYLWYQKKRR